MTYNVFGGTLNLALFSSVTWLYGGQFAPVRKPISRFLIQLHYWLEDHETMSASLWLSKIEDLQVLLLTRIHTVLWLSLIHISEPTRPY